MINSLGKPFGGDLGESWTTLFDAATDVVAWVDRDLRYRYINPAVETATGVPPAQFIGRTNDEIGIPSEQLVSWRKRMTGVLDSGRPTLFEFDFDTPSGLRRFQSVATPIADPSGRVESIFVISRDISDTRAIQLLEGAVHHLPTGVALVEAPSGRLLLRNRQATDIFRMAPTPASGVEGYRRFVGYRADGCEYQPEDWPLARSIRTGEIVTGEIAEILRGDGTRGFIRMTSAPVRDAAGTLIAGLVTFDDVTEATQAARREALLARATALLGESLERSIILERLAQLTVPIVADWCIVHTLDGGVIHLAAVAHADPARAAAARISGERFVVGGPASAVRRVLEGGPAELLPVLTEAMLRAAAFDDQHFSEMSRAGFRSAVVVPMTGRAGVIGSLTFVAADSGRSFDRGDLSFCQEIAGRAALALDNARLYDEARAAQAASEAALVTRDDFLAAASHELRNPLNALQLQLAGLRRAARRDPAALTAATVASRLEKAEDQVTRLVRLVDTFLDVSRIKAGRLELEYGQTDLVATARDIVEQLQVGLETPTIRLTAPGRIDGEWDALRLEQILANLLSNALKYGDGHPVDLTLAADQHTATIAVTDRGPGIPAELLPRLFQRFERLAPDRRRTGFGLGLWITREIVMAHAGRIDVRSEPGRGATFVVSLPRRRPEQGTNEASRGAD